MMGIDVDANVESDRPWYEAQQPEFAVQPDNRRPGFYAVPRGRLRPMRELWQLLEEALS